MAKRVGWIFSDAFSDAFVKFGLVDDPSIRLDADALLPDNATAIERELAALTGYVDEIDPALIETIWDAWRCPAGLLPWLAWAMSVDVWEDDWPEVARRQAIADSPEYHRRKGTLWAIEKLLALSGQGHELTEWFDRVPEGRRGTMSVHIEADLADVGAILRRIRPLVMAAKPKSRALFLGAGDVVEGAFVASLGLLVEELVEVEPYRFEPQDAESAFVAGLGLLVEELITVEAGTWP